MPIIIGLTGSSGSGKSTVAKEFEKLGFLVIDFDEITHSIYKTCDECINEIKRNFEGVVSNNTVDRKKLAKIVFADKKKLGILNETVHKYIMKRLYEVLDANKDKNIVLDAPLLFEAKLDKICTFTLCVVCDYEKKIERIKMRDGITYEAAQARLKNQKDDAYFTEKCDFSVENNGDFFDASAIKKIVDKINLGGANKK